MTEDSSKLLLTATPIIRARLLGRLLNLDGNFYLKWEGANPTGTHKDRAALLHARTARERGYSAITAGTCGNYGVAIAHYARALGLRAVVYVPKSYSGSRVHEMRVLGAKVVLVEGSYEDAVAASAASAAENEWYNANPGSRNSELGIKAYAQMALEIVEQVGDAPYAVAVPVGNGTTLVGLYVGFLKAYEEGVVTSIPKLIAATTTHANQIAVSWARGYPVSPEEVPVCETWVSEPLVAARAMDAEGALEALRRTGGEVYAFDDDEMIEAALALRSLEGIPALPAAAASTLALARVAREGVEGPLPLVAVVTGRWPSFRRQ